MNYFEKAYYEAKIEIAKLKKDVEYLEKEIKRLEAISNKDGHKVKT